MRLKITKQLSGSIDGLHLGRFEVGEVYDLGTALANYLLADGAAVPVIDEGATHGLPRDPVLLTELRRGLSGGDPSLQSKAADRKRRPTKRR